MKIRIAVTMTAMIILVMASAHTAHATQRTFVMSGTIAGSGISGVSVGDPFVATLSYDDAQAPFNTGADYAQYSSYTYVLEVAGQTFSKQPGNYMQVLQSSVDQFAILGTLPALQLDLRDAAGTTFSSTALPASLSLTNFNSVAQVAWNIGTANFFGNITSLTPLPDLTIDNVTLNELNSGTSLFTFTVSLSAPAGAGGVTFDIATVDGTAQDDNPATEDNDYVARTLTSQTIPSGSSTYTFDVTVNGDLAVESNETFFVNATNVVGATVSDGQGQGTITNDDAPCTANPIVINSNDSGPGSLRQAVIDACPGSTITFAGSVTSPISLSGGQIVIDKNLTIQGPGANLLTVRNTAASRVFYVGNVTATISGLTISGGELNAPFDPLPSDERVRGGGIFNSGQLNVTNCTISDNHTHSVPSVELYGAGDGIYNNGTLWVTNSLITNNTGIYGSFGGGFGGGIANDGNAWVTNSTVSNNHEYIGGGISNGLQGQLTVTNSTVSNNNADLFGGGIYNTGNVAVKGNVTVTHSTVSGNNANNGAGIYSDGDLAVTNSTVSGNVGVRGGGIQTSFGVVNLTNATVTNNSATFDGGGIFNDSYDSDHQPTVNSGNSIIAGNSAANVPATADYGFETDGVPSQDYGDITSLGYNLFGKVDAPFNVGMNGTGDQLGSTASPINPLLGVLANNGGPTMTHALLPGSPAINAGTNTGAPATDQRNIIRPQQTTTDIGAFESQGFTMLVSGGNSQSTLISTAFASPLSVTVSSAFSEPVDGGKVIFTPPASGASSTIAGNPATIASGTATTGTVTANANSGGYSVAASATGVSSSVNFSLTNTTISLPDLTINDVTQNELNSGSSNFTFTVSLSAPAGAGGVTFDIATADGTINPATQPSDYTAKTLTGQTISAGSSTYTFDVTVNGDVTVELDETFFVNVSNVIGATVTDGQGQGTITNDDAAVAPLSAVILATNSVWLKERSHILLGDVIVNTVSPGPTLDSQVELSVAERATTSTGYALKANRIKVKALATVGGSVYYNTLTNSGTISGSLNHPLSLPVLATLPPFPAVFVVGAMNKTVSKNQTMTLAPGNYGDIIVRDKGTVIFSGGTYNLRNLNAASQTKLLFAAASEVRIVDKFGAGGQSTIGPKTGSGIGASNIVFYVKGVNGSNGTLSANPKAATVGENSNVAANLYVPNGTFWIKENSNVTGALFARDVVIAEDVNVTMGSAFTNSFAKLGGEEGVEEQLIATAMPEKFGLMQNYPNPFNPTTTIQYVLPSNSRVTLDVYDMLGRRVAELVNGQVAAGYHEVEFNATNLASGIYFYRMNATGAEGKTFTQMRKLILMK